MDYDIYKNRKQKLIEKYTNLIELKKQIYLLEQNTLIKKYLTIQNQIKELQLKEQEIIYSNINTDIQNKIENNEEYNIIKNEYQITHSKNFKYNVKKYLLEK